MVTSSFMMGGPHRRRETAVQRAERLSRERAVLDAARAQIRDGDAISGEDLEAFLDRFERDDPLDPPPTPK